MATERIEISLAKALKLKNRLAGRLAKLDTDLETYNSVLAGSDQPDIKSIYAERATLVAHLVELKIVINAANQPMQRTIVELGEVKSQVALLRRMSTKHGTVVEGYHGVETQYIAQFRKGDVDREVRRLEREIDRLQDQLDGFNHRTTIGMGASLLGAIEATPPVSGA
jgi:hypothetical protein